MRVILVIVTAIVACGAVWIFGPPSNSDSLDLDPLGEVLPERQPAEVVPDSREAQRPPVVRAAKKVAEIEPGGTLPVATIKRISDSWRKIAAMQRELYDALSKPAASATTLEKLEYAAHEASLLADAARHEAAARAIRDGKYVVAEIGAKVPDVEGHDRFRRTPVTVNGQTRKVVVDAPLDAELRSLHRSAGDTRRAFKEHICREFNAKPKAERERIFKEAKLAKARLRATRAPTLREKPELVERLRSKLLDNRVHHDHVRCRYVP